MRRLMKTSFCALSIGLAASALMAQEEPLVIVEDGVLNPEVAEFAGEEWEEADGFLQQQGTGQYLWVQPVIGPGDFHVRAELQLQDMTGDDGRGAAASFAIDDMLQDDGANGANFGFIGGDGELFAEGSFFNGFLTLAEETPIQEGVLFQIDFIREGDTYRVLLDGEEMVSVPTPDELAEPTFRSGYYRVGLRPWRSLMQVKNFTIQSGVANFDPIEEREVFVEDGVAQNIVEVGLPWIAADGSLENFEPGNFLFGERAIFGSNYKVTARLNMELIEGSAAAFNINGDNNLGFSGGSGTMFTEGSFFADAPDLNIAPPIEESEFFEFEMISQQNTIRFLIDGQEILAMEQPGEFVGFVGFRPWRSIMQIADFAVEPLQAEMLTPPNTERTFPAGREGIFFPGETISGMQLNVTIGAGDSGNALITETLPEGWSAANFDASNGSAQLSGNTIEWQLAGAQDAAQLTYDLIVPNDPPAAQVAFSGAVETEGVDGLVTGPDSLLVGIGPNQEIAVVENGQMTEQGLVIGEAWLELDGALERTGTGNFLLGNFAIANVDYQIEAELTMFGVGGTAASINMRRVSDGAQSNFGFDGGGNNFFLEGPFFTETPGFDSTTVLDGTPFTFRMVREGGVVEFLVNDEVIHSDPQETYDAFQVGLRPWRSRMQVTQFIIQTGEETPVVNWALY